MITTAFFILVGMMMLSTLIVLLACIGAGRASRMEGEVYEEYTVDGIPAEMSSERTAVPAVGD